MNYDANYVYQMFEKYFDTDRATVDSYLKSTTPGNKIDKERLQAILKGVEKSLDVFCDKTSADRKHKVADKLLKKLNYDSFFQYESYYGTISRLETVYNYTTSKNINVYQIIGSTMLVEANLMVERKGESKKEITDAYEWAPRMIWNIYDSVKNIGFSDAELVDIFEHAKTIFSKGFSSSIDDLNKCVENEYFSFKIHGEKFNFLDRKAFMETVKSCQTILVYPAPKLKINIEYMIDKTLGKITDIEKGYVLDFQNQKMTDEQIAASFVKYAISQKASLLTSKVVRDKYDEQTIKSDDIDNFVDKNFAGYLKNGLKINTVSNIEDEEDERLDETELLAKYGNMFDDGLSDADRNAYYRIVGREDKIAEDDGLSK